jgi:uncharacterized protein YbjT (DUF2867 family)
MMMRNILILGASGQVAVHARRALLAETDNQLTLFVRHPEKLGAVDPLREKVVVGDALSLADLFRAMAGVDLVYANLGGEDIEFQSANVVTAMLQLHIPRLIWISTLGIYDEVPGEFGRYNKAYLGKGGDHSYLETYRRAALTVSESDLDSTILRPAWLTNRDDVDYELTDKGEPFKGTVVSRRSVGELVARIIQNPDAYVDRSLGVSKPHTAGDRPRLYA